MTMHLVVVRPFGRHAKGDVIAAAAEVSVVLGSENSGSVVRVAHPVAELNEVEEG